MKTSVPSKEKLTARFLGNLFIAIWAFQACGRLPANQADMVAGQSTSTEGQPGPQGPAGKDGTNGSNGVDGKNGKDGTNGQPGSILAPIPSSVWQNPMDNILWAFINNIPANQYAFIGCTGSYRQPTIPELTKAAQDGIRASFMAKGYTIAAYAWGSSGGTANETQIDLSNGTTSVWGFNTNYAIFCIGK